MTKLIDKGFSREQAYDTVQPRAMQAWEERRQFREIVESTPEITEVLSAEEIEDAFNPSWHLKHVDTIFAKLGLSNSDTKLIRIHKRSREIQFLQRRRRNCFGEAIAVLKAFHRKASIESIYCPRISTIKSYVIEIWGNRDRKNNPHS